MKEKIIHIRHTDFRHQDRNMEGFEIITENQIIQMGIESRQQCCESAGYIVSEDNINEFVGANVLSIKLIDTSTNSKVLKELETLHEPYTMFVNIETDKGLLQFVAYNSHNGYYGHNVTVISKELNHEEYL